MRRLAIVLSTLGLTGCSASTFHPAASPTQTAAGSPLGPSYILVPLPNDDDSLLGRVLLDVPENGRSLDEVSRPNECADKLNPKKLGPLASTFEDGQELAAGGKARAALGAFGFEGDAQTATHFYYKLDVNKRVAQTDTTEYVQCCRDKGTCGYGFVSALIYGDGQYATATETSAEGSVDIPVAGEAGGFVRAKVLHRRNVHGYVAALVTVTDASRSKESSIIGDPTAIGVALTEQTLPEQVKGRFDAQKVRVTALTCRPPLVLNGNDCVDASKAGSPTTIDFAYVFRDGNGPITENEFARRYAAITGSHDLDDAVRNRMVGLSALAGASFAGFATLGVVGILNLQRNCDGHDGQGSGTPGCTQSYDPNTMVYGPVQGTTPNPLGQVGAAVGGLGVLLTGFLAILELKYDGGPSDHVITKFDADLYAAKYNRALLRKTIQETKERMQQLSGRNDVAPQPSLRLTPVISPGFMGIVGQF